MRFVFLIAAAKAINPRRLNTDSAEFVDDQMVQFAAEYNEDAWNDKLSKFNNITQYGFNDYLNTGHFESIAQQSVNASLEYKQEMAQLGEAQKDAEEQLEADTKKSEELQKEFNDNQR